MQEIASIENKINSPMTSMVREDLVAMGNVLHCHPYAVLIDDKAVYDWFVNVFKDVPVDGGTLLDETQKNENVVYVVSVQKTINGNYAATESDIFTDKVKAFDFYNQLRNDDRNRCDILGGWVYKSYNNQDGESYESWLKGGFFITNHVTITLKTLKLK